MVVNSPAEIIVGRFAPSPTGPLHFGSLVAAVGSYCLARQTGGRWLVRIDDLDTPRVVPGAADAILQSLEALGLNWDGDVVWQSRRQEAYREALARLEARGLVYACGCSRREILASAPHPGEEGPIYPGTCRNGLPPGRHPRAERVRVAAAPVCFRDGIFGPQEQHLADAVGDFVLRRADGIFAYQLATVVDDAAAGVNQVVRGADLLGSTPRQIYLHACLGSSIPQYVHLPLALGEDGEKLSKRHVCGGKDVRVAGGRWVGAVLEFLGQSPPPALRGAPAREVLAWGIDSFALDRVPTSARRPGPWGGDN